MCGHSLPVHSNNNLVVCGVEVVCVLRRSSSVRLVGGNALQPSRPQHAACWLFLALWHQGIWLLFACTREALSRRHKDAGGASGRAAKISSTSAARWPQAVESACWRIVLADFPPKGGAVLHLSCRQQDRALQ